MLYPNCERSASGTATWATYCWKFLGCFFQYRVLSVLPSLRSEPLHVTLYTNTHSSARRSRGRNAAVLVISTHPHRNHWCLGCLFPGRTRVTGSAVAGKLCCLESEALQHPASECSWKSAEAWVWAQAANSCLCTGLSTGPPGENLNQFKMESDVMCSCLCVHYLHAFLARYSHTSVSHLDHADIVGTITYREKKRWNITTNLWCSECSLEAALSAITSPWRWQEKTNIQERQRVQRKTFLWPAAQPMETPQNAGLGSRRPDWTELYSPHGYQLFFLSEFSWYCGTESTGGLNHSRSSPLSLPIFGGCDGEWQGKPPHLLLWTCYIALCVTAAAVLVAWDYHE